MKYIVNIQDVKNVLGVHHDTNLTIAPVELSADQVKKLIDAGCNVKEPEILEAKELADIDYEKKRSAWIKFKKKNITGRGIKVGNLDTGIYTGYFPVEYTQNFTSESPLGNHGTMTASIIKDIAPDCELHSIKVVTSGGISEADLLEGIDYCITNGIHIVNMSFNVIKTTAIESALNDMHNAGIVMFAAVGNNSTPADLSYPAWHQHVVAVNAVKEDGSIAYQNWNIPSGGTHGIHIACSGWGARVIDYLGNSYGNNGTSFSSPFAVGIAALTLEEIGTVNISKLKQTIFNKTVKQQDATAFGYGLINC